MTNLPYIIEAQICFAILWLFYRVVLRRSNTFVQNRFYLLTMALVSFIIPLLSIPVYAAKIISGGYNITVISEEFTAVAADDAQIGMAEILMYIYLAGVAIMLTILLFNGIKVLRIYKNAKIATRGVASVYHTDKIQSCFSFFNCIFLNPKDLNEGEIQQVMIHELAHIKLHHSRDLILGQALLIALWWNPFVWFWFRSLKEVHEFQADEAVLNDSGGNSEYYISLILKEIADIHPEFVSGFSYSLIKTRLIMITSHHPRRFARFRILLSLPILLILLTLFSFTEREAIIENKTFESTSAFIPDNDAPTPAKRSSSSYTSSKKSDDPDLYFIDGVLQDVPIDLSKIDTAKIEHITSLYGSVAKEYAPNAKNKVIIITTKKGTQNKSIIKENLPIASESSAPELIMTVSATKTKENPITIYEGFDANSPDSMRISFANLTFHGHPVYIIDGIVHEDQQSLKKLSADKIESISILKNASAAVYGPNAKNGVFLITTKKGAQDNSTAQINLTDNSAKITVADVRSSNDTLKGSIEFTTPDKPSSKATKSVTTVTFADVQKVESEIAFTKVEKMPKFQGGGVEKFQRWVMGRMRNLNAERIQSRVIISFVVKKDGSIDNVEIYNSPGGPIAGKAMGIVKSSPKWTPGEKDGKPVNVRFTLSIDIR